MKNLIIFLDFDGVLHHSKIKNYSQSEKFLYINNFENAVKEILELNIFNLKIIFSTSWKEHFSFDDLKGFFEEYPNCYHSFIGCTNNLNLNFNGYKWIEAQEWMKENNFSDKYIIIDDSHCDWLGAPINNILICDDKFDHIEKSKLLLMINNIKAL